MPRILKAQQRNNLILQFRKSKKIDEYKRLFCILAFDDGVEVKQIADRLFISPSAVYHYLQEFIDNNKTDSNDKGGKTENLSEEQIQDLIKHLETKTYLKCESIIKFIRDNYNVCYTKSGVKKLLHRHHFVYKKPIKVPGKINPEQQKQFADYYQKLKTEINPQQEEILFFDGVHPDHQTQAVYGWIKKGHKLAIPTTAKQPRIHYLGAIAVKEDKIEHITQSYDKINGEAVVNFLAKIANKLSHKKKIHIILDNAGYHKCKEVKEYLEQHPKIQLHYLPPYSPNLNLIERLWKIMREKVTYNKYYKTFLEFRTKIAEFFENLDDIQDILTKRITEKFQIINPTFFHD